MPTPPPPPPSQGGWQRFREGWQDTGQEGTRFNDPPPRQSQPSDPGVWSVVKTARARRYKPYPQRLFARAPRHGRRRRWRDGCRAGVAPVSIKLVSKRRQALFSAGWRSRRPAPAFKGMGLDGLTTCRVTVEVQTPPVAVKYEVMLDGLSYVPERVTRGCTHDELGDPSEAHPAGGGRRYGTPPQTWCGRVLAGQPGVRE